MFDEKGLPYLYETVAKNEWTLDYHASLVEDFYEDLNGDGKRDEEDLYGHVSSAGINVDAYWSACDLPMVQKNAEGEYEWVLDNAKISDLTDKLLYLFYESGGSYLCTEGANNTAQPGIRKMFAESRAATVTLRLLAVELDDIRNMQEHYGIVPMPKFDETQTGYYSAAHNQITVYGIPLTVTGEDLEMMGALMEALASESYKTVMPAYYEVALKTKYVSDDESAKMLDKVIDNLYLDAGFFYSDNIPFYKQMRTWIGSNNNNVSSYIKSAQRILDKQVEALNDSFRKVQ
jgi:hypothetical protein